MKIMETEDGQFTRSLMNSRITFRDKKKRQPYFCIPSAVFFNVFFSS